MAEIQAPPVENLTLWQRVYGHLRSEILDGSLEPGTELLEVALSEHLGVSRGDGGIRRETRDNLEVTLIARRTDRVRDERNPQAGELGEAEAWRHHTDDGVRDSVETNGLPDDSAIAAVAARPDCVAQHDDRAGPNAIIGRFEAAPQQRLHSK